MCTISATVHTMNTTVTSTPWRYLPSWLQTPSDSCHHHQPGSTNGDPPSVSLWCSRQRVKRGYENIDLEEAITRLPKVNCHESPTSALLTQKTSCSHLFCAVSITPKEAVTVYPSLSLCYKAFGTHSQLSQWVYSKPDDLIMTSWPKIRVSTGQPYMSSVTRWDSNIKSC